MSSVSVDVYRVTRHTVPVELFNVLILNATMKGEINPRSTYSVIPVSYRKRRTSSIVASIALLFLAVTFTGFFPSSLPFLHDRNLSLPLRTEEQWKDDIWPIREQTPWDISTDFPHPNVLEYEVNEGTWLRLDVNPVSKDIVFDMLGDLYCISGDSLQNLSKGDVNIAHPVTLGVPYDSDPHFSPKGDRLVFRSDAGLGVDNIWITKWQGCKQMNLRPGVGDILSSPLQTALLFKAEDQVSLNSGVQETPEKKQNRLLREGRAQALMVTNETYRFVTDARFHPSGDKVIVTKWYTSERSLGGGEGWEYTVPSTEQHPIQAGDGTQIIGRTLPRGWNASQYGDQQVGPEQFIWNGEDGIIYSKNVRDEFQFEYSKDIHQGIYALFSLNLTTGVTETLVDAFPGGASRPELSHDRRTLAFVRRVRDHEVLVLKDLESGSLNYAWDGLSFDLTTISAPMGTYPSFCFTPDSDGIVIWAAGKLHHVPLGVNERGERVRSGSVNEIRFIAHIEKHLADTRWTDNAVDLVGLETGETQRIYAFRDLRVDETGSKVVFRAGNIPVLQVVGEDTFTRVPTLYNDDGKTPYYTPSFIPGTEGNLIIMSRWSDVHFTSFEVSDLTKGVSYDIEGPPIGRYRNPVLCQCSGSNRTIAFLKTGGDYLTGDLVATAGTGLYVGDLDLEPSPLRKLTVTNLRWVPSEIDPDDADIKFIEKNKKLLVQQADRVFIIDLEGGPIDVTGKPPHFTKVSGKMSAELVIAPRPQTPFERITHRNSGGFEVEHVAFVDFFHVYVAFGKDIKDEEVWSKPGKATAGLARVSLDGGHDIAWSSDGKKLFWFLGMRQIDPLLPLTNRSAGPYLHWLEISKLSKCSSTIKNDTNTFGISCVKNLVQYQEIVLEHSTDIARLKKETQSLDPSASDILVIFNATVLTMETGNIDEDLVEHAVLVVRGGVIESIAPTSGFVAPERATLINARGGFVIPGFIDAHAHWNGMSNPHPAKSWEMQTFLSFGVTTMHNPSSDNVDGFVERSRLESGQFIGPRIFHTGDVIYGAGASQIHADVVDMKDAYSTLTRIKAEGAPSPAYQINSASRQRLLLAARNLSMLCVPEGGMNYDWDLTYIMDGMTTLEHSLPVPTQYEDVLTLFALSGTANTPTHLVNYGGAFGEQYIWAAEDVPVIPSKHVTAYGCLYTNGVSLRLRRFSRQDILEGVTESTARPKLSYQFFNTSASNAKMVPRGLKTLVGAHGEPPLGLNYHYEIFFTQQGGLSNYQSLQAATSWAAQVYGIFNSVGSLSPGKLADFLVYPPGVDLLSGSILETLKLEFVARGGRVWVAGTMKELFPGRDREIQQMPPINP
ncbi:hypothetical protein BDP27DRAFT_1422041 [Rhodocollybia butyracea]|uniref:Amidohydrolase-related domain-containing protein n=1 Tax=Rhodocollybia butyracea TaxID=206335 RepID=A0A9P5PM14_9AGAR|nr:hypothetical protein BDP27DRAFT_1422041 [Rhodocollybia butyracea]